MSVELNGWYWVEWRGTLEPELFREGRIQDHDGDWIMPAPTRNIGPRIPEPKELKAIELELAKLRNRVDDLDKTLDETREERDRLRAEVERLRPKESGGGWRFFAPAFELQGCWVVRGGNGGLLFHVTNKAVSVAVWCSQDDAGHQKLTAAEAYARLADWPEGQRKFRELTGYVPPTCKESLPVQPEERARCYLGRDGKLRCYKDREECLFIDNHEDVHLAQPEQLTIDDGHKRITVAEAIEIVRDRPKQLAKLREMVGIETPKDSVRCYRSKYGSSVLVYGVQHNTHFSPHGDWGPAQSESATIKNKFRCTISEARALLADKPASLAEFDRMAGIEEEKDSVRCYRCEDREVVWVYTTSERVCFCTKYDENASVAQDDEHRPSHIPCTIGEARRLLARLPKSLAEFDRITTGRDEDREHLARLMAIPCKEMRV